MSQDQTLKDRFANAVEMTRERIQQTADKVRSGIHDVKSETAPNFIEKTSEMVKGRVDDLKAKIHETKADDRMKKMMEPMGKMASKRNLMILGALGIGALLVARRRRMA
ncbi:hypothetical protein [Deinococcus misasensis]|uniref:hypothetical protein n=1 Tax=Deinococcus misasensis TaxID=392413 RepID=UPI0005550B8D|nr:hypothetical protein [Deinococcus misasensis]